MTGRIRRPTRITALTIVALLASGGCTSNSGKDDPPPVKTKADAEHSARALIGRLAGQ
ncbi:hypothetical protein [Streptomyces lydicus]|uniref:hypothetical protein n=1 Tax=Streptomyces lydicus TaxID=47763 RepID=UPI000B06F636|nr:hypothetical protein [Streptomyces lydicus]MDC7335852.1 hypothetical protein [Streptomyces lydicus]UEG94902.1 hypothetical protein LJ741_32820 [Streptomyces lydicus]